MQENKFAATYYFGATIVHIDNSKVAKTEEEKEAVLVEVKNAVLSILDENSIFRREVK